MPLVLKDKNTDNEGPAMSQNTTNGLDSNDSCIFDTFNADNVTYDARV